MSQDDIRSRLEKFRQQLPDEAKDEYYADTARRLDTIIGGDTSHFLRARRRCAHWTRVSYIL
jgi:hypothetical protein